MKSLRPIVLLAAAILLFFGSAAGSPARAQVREIEPNSPCLLAQNLGAATLPLTISGSLDVPPTVPDVDFYRFTATPGELVLIELRGRSSGQGTLRDPFLGYFTASCALSTYNDDGAGGFESRIEITVPEDGVVVIAASSSFDPEFAGRGSSAGTYTLTVKKVPLAQGITGRLVDAETGAPLATGYVDLRSCSDGDCWYPRGHLYTDSEGRFRFEPGQPGLYGPVLRAGEYQLEIYASSQHQFTTLRFEVAEGEYRNLGDVPVSPVPFVGSIRGRLVDAATGAPLSGVSEPFATVDLLHCLFESYCHPVAYEQTPDSQGGFELRSDWWVAGKYRILVRANQYHTFESATFDVADGEHYDLGNVAIKSFPVRLTLAQGCTVPASGGDCELQIRVANGGTGTLQADVWTLVRAVSGPYSSSSELTQFQAGNTKPVNLAPGSSADLAYTFRIPGSLAEGVLICGKAYAADKRNPFEAIGSHDVFCLRKGLDSVTVVPEAEKRRW